MTTGVSDHQTPRGDEKNPPKHVSPAGGDTSSNLSPMSLIPLEVIFVFLKFEELSEILTKIEIIITVGLNDDKNLGGKSRWTVPLHATALKLLSK